MVMNARKKSKAGEGLESGRAEGGRVGCFCMWSGQGKPPYWWAEGNSVDGSRVAFFRQREEQVQKPWGGHVPLELWKQQWSMGLVRSVYGERCRKWGQRSSWELCCAGSMDIVWWGLAFHNERDGSHGALGEEGHHLAKCNQDISGYRAETRQKMKRAEKVI